MAAINIDAKLVRNQANKTADAAAPTTTSDLAPTVELQNGCACAPRFCGITRLPGGEYCICKGSDLALNVVVSSSVWEPSDAPATTVFGSICLFLEVLVKVWITLLLKARCGTCCRQGNCCTQKHKLSDWASLQVALFKMSSSCLSNKFCPLEIATR